MQTPPVCIMTVFFEIVKFYSNESIPLVSWEMSRTAFPCHSKSKTRNIRILSIAIICKKKKKKIKTKIIERNCFLAIDFYFSFENFWMAKKNFLRRCAIIKVFQTYYTLSLLYKIIWKPRKKKKKEKNIPVPIRIRSYIKNQSLMISFNIFTT